MKFIKILQPNQEDFYLINLANITHVVCNQKSRTCLAHLVGEQKITLLSHQAHSLLVQISEYNRQYVEYLTK